MELLDDAQGLMLAKTNDVLTEAMASAHGMAALTAKLRDELSPTASWPETLTLASKTILTHAPDVLKSKAELLEHAIEQVETTASEFKLQTPSDVQQAKGLVSELRDGYAMGLFCTIFKPPTIDTDDAKRSRKREVHKIEKLIKGSLYGKKTFQHFPPSFAKRAEDAKELAC
jgi:hypothetical protein